MRRSDQTDPDREGIAMRPFHLKIAQTELDDLRQRLASTRMPPELTGVGWTRGMPLAYLHELVEYWRSGFDWRGAERRINSYPQFITEIDGQRMHFFHMRSPHPDATPLLMIHGWPGLNTEFLDLLGPLTDPVAHGGDPGDAFHVVLPALPGFGFSSPVTEVGWDIPRMAPALVELMRRLGYERYVTQGGDAGSLVAQAVAAADPKRVVGVHVNMLLTFPSGDPAEVASFDEVDHARLSKLEYFDEHLSGYMKLQATRPQSLAYALTDSPAGQLAWIAERFREWTDPNHDGVLPVSMDYLLTLVSIYWFTRTAGSSGQFYYEDRDNVRKARAAEKPPPLSQPVGVAVFPHDIFVPIRSLAMRDIPSISHWTEFDRGGHFPALEQPDLLVSDLRTFTRSLPAHRHRPIVGGAHQLGAA